MNGYKGIKDNIFCCFFNYVSLGLRGSHKPHVVCVALKPPRLKSRRTIR